MTGLLVWGAGGHGKVVLDCATEMNTFQPIAFIDDNYRDVARFCNRDVLGDSCTALTQAADLGFSDFVVAIGNNTTRSRCFEQALAAGFHPATIVHPRAIVSSSSRIQAGTVVMVGAIVNAGASIGHNCIINSAAVVEHDCRIEDHVHLSPGVLLGGAVTVRRFAHVGLGAIVLPGVEIGEHATVGAGAVVVDDAPAGVTVVGIPARAVEESKNL
ncbi:MAG TPA: acetyltransferase [Bryobacteraceae bacterium]|nr:acetyltransferase [Bryobacteraceae bacterium]